MEESAERISLRLFPYHKRIVTEFAARDRRSFSNALQVIIEEWARMNAREESRAMPEHTTAEQPVC